MPQILINVPDGVQERGCVGDDLHASGRGHKCAHDSLGNTFEILKYFGISRGLTK